MKTITIFCCLLLAGFSPILHAQNEINLNDLLAELENNHMGAISDVFTSEELAVLEAHFSKLRGEETNFDTRGPKIRLYGPENVGDDFGWLDTNAPGVFNTIGPSGTADFDGAGAIPPGGLKGHLIDNAGNYYEVDILTGQYIPMGIITPPSGESFTGIEFSPINGTAMAISTDGTTNTSTLSIIDFAGMTATPVGNTGLRLPIALSINGNGMVYTYDIDDDILYELNASNATATAKGPLGFNADFGGGMVYDPNTSKTYITSYNPAIGDSQLREVNTTNGMTTVVGTIDPGPTSQMAWAGIVNSIILDVVDNTLAGFGFTPNPATGIIQLRANASIEDVQVYNMLGQKIMERRIDSLNGVLDVSNLSAGAYLLSVVVDGRSGTYHIIKR